MADVTLKGLLGEFRNYLRDASPGGLLNPEITPERAKNALEYVSMTPTPFGDAASGLLAGNYLMKGQFGNAGLEAIGLLPFVPGITKGAVDFLPDGWKVLNGKGLSKNKYLVEFNDPKLGKDITNAFNTQEEAINSAHDIIRSRHGFDAARVAKRNAMSSIKDKVLSGGGVTKEDLKLMGLKEGQSRLDYLSPAMQDLFGINARQFRDMAGSAIKKGQGIYGGTIEFADPVDAINNIAMSLNKLTK